MRRPRLDPRDVPSAARLHAWRATTPPWTRVLCALLLCGALVGLVLGGGGGDESSGGGKSPRYVDALCEKFRRVFCHAFSWSLCLALSSFCFLVRFHFASAYPGSEREAMSKKTHARARARARRERERERERDEKS